MRRKEPALFQAPQPGAVGKRSLSTVVQIIVLAALVVVAAAWALADHFAEGRARPPMLVPSPRGAATYDADAGEIPVPETFWDGG